MGSGAALPGCAPFPEVPSAPPFLVLAVPEQSPAAGSRRMGGLPGKKSLLGERAPESRAKRPALLAPRGQWVRTPGPEARPAGG